MSIEEEKNNTVSKFVAVDNEFLDIQDQSLLSIVSILTSLPKNSIPSPAKQRKYLATVNSVKNATILSFFSPIRVLTGSLSLLSFVAVAFIGYGISNSLPGGGFAFGVKKSTEQLRVKLAHNSISQINLQIELSRKRLEEAQSIIINNPTNATAALTELNTQTKNTIASVENSKDKDQIIKDPSIIAKLSSLAEEQLRLINTVKSSAGIDESTKQALNSTQDGQTFVATVKKLATATSEEKLIEPKDLPVILSGEITELGEQYFILDKTKIILPLNIAINSELGKKLFVRQKVSVSAVAQGDQLVAKEITVEKQPQTQNTTSITTSPTPNENQTANETIETEETNTLKGIFIYEDPNPTTNP